MGEDIALPRNGGMVSEAFVERRCAELMREYDGVVFLLCSPGDWERISTFTRAAQAAGRDVINLRDHVWETGPAALARTSGRSAIFVFRSKVDDLDEYLEACPAGQRHLALLTQRPGGSRAPMVSRLLMSFLDERGVDILETRGIDEVLDKECQ